MRFLGPGSGFGEACDTLDSVARVPKHALPEGCEWGSRGLFGAFRGVFGPQTARKNEFCATLSGLISIQ